MSNVIDKITIKEINDLNQMHEAFEVVNMMYQDMELETYKSIIEEMVNRNDYKMIGAFLDGELIGVCGYWIFTMLYCKRYIQISNLVINPKFRNLGIGKKILKHAESIGQKNKCNKIVLDSYTQNTKSHSLYFKEGYHIRGFHFMKSI